MRATYDDGELVEEREEVERRGTLVVEPDMLLRCVFMLGPADAAIGYAPVEDRRESVWIALGGVCFRFADKEGEVADVKGRVEDEVDLACLCVGSS